MSGGFDIKGGPGRSLVPTRPGGSSSGDTVRVSTVDIAALAANATVNALAAGAIGLELAELAAAAELAEASAYDFLGAVEVAAAITAAGVGPNGVAAAVARLGLHAERLTRAAVEYELTETGVAALTAGINNVLLNSAQFGPLGALIITAQNVASEVGDVFADMADGKPVNESLRKNGLELLREEAEPAITGFGDALGGPQLIGALLAGGLGFTSLGTTGMKLQVSAHPSTTRAAKSGLNGIVANGLDTVVGQDAVSVTAIRNPGQRPRYILSVPGTTQWWDNSHPLDANSNFAEEAGIPSDARRLALAAARAKIPPGAEVMVVGYSQGGIVGANLAADPEFNRQYQVRGLLTVASPTAKILPRIPGQVQSMAIEHRDDLVPQVDGARAVPSFHQWVMRSNTPSGAKSFHAYEGGYRKDIDALSTSTDPAAVAYRKAVDQFMAKPGATAEITQFDGKRIRK